LVEVEQWAEIRRMHFVCGLSIKEIARRTGRDRNTVRRALRSSEPPRYVRAPRPSKLEPFKDEIHRLLREEPEMPGQRIRELIEALGFDYRLNRAGDRQLNCALHTIVLTRLQHDPATRAYAARRLAEGKTPREIKRCLKRYVARSLFRRLEATGPHRTATSRPPRSRTIGHCS
jgi:hypothetical protein